MKIKIKKSYLTAGLVALLAVLWLLSPLATGREQPTLTENVQDKNLPPQVRAEWSHAQTRTAEIIVRGRTEAERTVHVRAETVGSVRYVPFPEGSHVNEGDTLCALSLEARKAQREEAAAMLALRGLELEGSQTLERQGFRAKTALAAARAAYDAAQARLSQINIDIAHTNIKAPFDGILETLHVEQGDYLTPGMPCATVIDIQPVIITGQVTEADVQNIKQEDDNVTIRLLNGTRFNGRIRYIAASADPKTRTFRLEVEADPDEWEPRAGVTAEIRISLDPADAHRISPAILTLNSNGQIGVRTLSREGIVHFLPVEIISAESDAFWVSGLPSEVQIITVGQEFVTDGARARAAQTPNQTISAQQPLQEQPLQEQP